jgi:cobalamin synthase
MIADLAFIRSPLGRFAVLAGVVALLIGWASLERMGRHAASARAEAAEAEVAARDQAIAALEQAAAESAARPGDCRAGAGSGGKRRAPGENGTNQKGGEQCASFKFLR